MEANLISIEQFCVSNNIEISFISTLQQNGLIEVTSVEESLFIDSDQLEKLERIARLHYELEINLEGIESIIYLLQQIDELKHEVVSLKNRLRRYEL